MNPSVFNLLCSPMVLKHCRLTVPRGEERGAENLHKVEM